MRFVSQYEKYVVQISPKRIEPLGDGTSRTLKEPIYAIFKHVGEGGMLYENEREDALKHFIFHGEQQHQDEATMVDVAQRLSIYDTDEEAKENGWSEEDKALVEATLTRKATTTPQAVMAVTSTPIQAPFPAYDTYDGDVEELVVKLNEDGFNLDEVLHYERTFGPKRPEVIAGLEIGSKALRENMVAA